MQMSTRVAIACSASLLLAGCAKSDQAAKDSAAAAAAAAAAPAAAPAPAAPAAIALADVAGKWNMVATPESGKDTSSTKTVLTATADTTGWTLKLPNGVMVPLHPMASGDSVVTTSDTYSSVRRKGVKVHTVTTVRMQDGKLVGMTVAHYQNAGPDSVLNLRTEATKAP